MKFKFIKVSIFTTLLLILLTSCGNLFFADVITPTEEQMRSLQTTISGSLSLDGAIPSELIPSTESDLSGRTAFPDNVTSDLIYSVTATNNGTPEGTATVTDTSFTITGLNLGQTYTITATGTKDGVVVLSGSTTLTLTYDTINSITICLKAGTTGTGTINLSLGYDEDIPVSRVVCLLDGNELTTSMSGRTVTIQKDNVQAGAHKLTVRFYKTITDGSKTADTLIFQCTEAINVFPGLTTDTWIRNSESNVDLHLIPVGKQYHDTDTGPANFQLNSHLTRYFETITYYVDPTTTVTTPTGSILNPFPSIESALEKLSSLPCAESLATAPVIVLNADADYTINTPIEISGIKVNIWMNSSEVETASINVQGSSAFSVKNGAEVHIESLDFSPATGASNVGFITVDSSSTAEMTFCSFTDSSASAITNYGSLDLSYCSFNNNNSLKGCDIFTTGTVSLDSCTFIDPTGSNSSIYAKPADGATGPISITVKGTTTFNDYSLIKLVQNNGYNAQICIDEDGDYTSTTKIPVDVSEAVIGQPVFCGNAWSEDLFDIQGFTTYIDDDGTPRSGTILYVNSAAQAGGSGTKNKPFKTISDALGTLAGLDEISDAPVIKVTSTSTSPVVETTAIYIEEGLNVTIEAADDSAYISVSGTEFKIVNQASITLKNLTFTRTDDSYLEDTENPCGGFLTTYAPVTCENCTFQNGRSYGHGGAIWSSGALWLTNCTFSDNKDDEGNHANAIHLDTGASLNLYGTTSFGSDQISLYSSMPNTAVPSINLKDTFVYPTAPIVLYIDIEDIPGFIEKKIVYSSNMQKVPNTFSVETGSTESFYSMTAEGQLQESAPPTEVYIDPKANYNGPADGSLDKPYTSLDSAYSEYGSIDKAVTYWIKDGSVLDLFSYGIKIQGSSGSLTIKVYKDTPNQENGNAVIKKYNYNDMFSVENGGSLIVKGISFENEPFEETNTNHFVEIKGESSYASFTSCSFTDGCTTNNGQGGAIYSEGTLLLNSTTFNRNKAEGSEGGAIYSSGSIEAYNCTFSENMAESGGNAIYNASGSVKLSGCSFNFNSVPEHQMAVYSAGTVEFDGDNAFLQGDYIELYSGEGSAAEIKIGNDFAPSGNIQLYIEYPTNFAAQDRAVLTGNVTETNISKFNLFGCDAGWSIGDDGKFIEPPTGTGNGSVVVSGLNGDITVTYSIGSSGTYDFHTYSFKDSAGRSIPVSDIAYELWYYGDSIESSESTWEVGSSSNQLKLYPSLYPGKWTIIIYFTYDNAAYSATFYYNK